MKDLIPRKKATIKIEISKNSKKKVSVKVSHYSNATSEMEDEERKQYLLSEGFDCQNEPIFLINLKSKIADFLQEEFRNSGVDEVEKLFVNLIYE
jgi:hypothetical protein